MIIAQISDTHIQSQEASARSRLEDLARAVASINALRPRAAAVVHTGDIAHDATPSDYAAARAALSRLACPLYATVGNRDRRGPFLDAFAPDGYLARDSAFVQFAINLGPLRIVAVDTLHGESHLGGFCGERELDLRRLLDACPEQPTLVFLHHAPVIVPGLPEPALQFRDPARALALARLIAKRSSVVAVLAGHVHRARTVAFGAVTLSTVPSIATDLRKEVLPCRHVGRPIYHVHTVNGADVASASILA